MGNKNIYLEKLKKIKMILNTNPKKDDLLNSLKLFLNEFTEKEDYIESLRQLPFLKNNENAEEINMDKIPIQSYKDIFKKYKNYHRQTMQNMDQLVYYASVWLKLGCPYYTEADLFNYYGDNYYKCDDFSLLDNIRALYIGDPPIIFYDDIEDSYIIYDGRHRMIALDEASKKLNIPVKLVVNHSVGKNKNGYLNATCTLPKIAEKEESNDNLNTKRIK